MHLFTLCASSSSRVRPYQITLGEVVAVLEGTNVATTRGGAGAWARPLSCLGGCPQGRAAEWGGVPGSGWAHVAHSPPWETKGSRDVLPTY